MELYNLYRLGRGVVKAGAKNDVVRWMTDNTAKSLGWGVNAGGRCLLWSTEGILRGGRWGTKLGMRGAAIPTGYTLLGLTDLAARSFAGGGSVDWSNVNIMNWDWPNDRRTGS